jgi:hypothetical protein
MATAPSLLSVYLLLFLSMASGFLLIGLPRAIAPTELPALSLPESDVTTQQREDEQLAAAAPHTPGAEQLLTLYQTFGQTEYVALESQALSSQRRIMLHRAYDQVREEAGPRGALALRAHALAMFEAALDDRVHGEAIRGWLGVFPNVLADFLATRNGLERAPHFVVRTLYKARWNRLLNLPVDSDFAKIERQAYYGWLGLHAYNLPLQERRSALVNYAAAGGEHASEAQGVLAFADRDYIRAVECLERAYQENPNWRIRNYLRGARVAAGMLGDAAANQTHEADVSAHD